MKGHRSRGRWALPAGLALLFIGCEGGRTNRQATYDDEDQADDPIAARAADDPLLSVAIVLPKHSTPGKLVWSRATQLELAKAKGLSDVARPNADVLASARQALDRSPGVLWAVVDDPVAFAPIANEAKSRGVPLLTLGDARLDDGTPAVVTDDHTEAARALVAAVRTYANTLDQRNEWIQGAEAALVMTAGLESDPRAKALEAALAAEKIPIRPPIRHAGSRLEATASVKEAVARAPKLRFLLGVDDPSYEGLIQARHEIRDESKYKLVGAGFTSYTDGDVYTQGGASAAAALLPVEDQVRRAIELSRQLALNKPIPPRTLIPYKIVVGDPLSEPEFTRPPDAPPVPSAFGPKRVFLPK